MWSFYSLPSLFQQTELEQQRLATSLADFAQGSKPEEVLE
jgi:hypothetical protein